MFTRMSRLTRVATVIGVVVVSLLAYEHVSAQSGCSGCTAQSADHSNAGMFRLTASTTRGAGFTDWLRVIAYIVDLPTHCPQGQATTGACLDDAITGNAVVTAASPGCGMWAGISHHGYRIGGTGYAIQENRETELYAGPCETPPDECGEDEYWDGERCIPIYCPIIINTDQDQKYKLTSADKGVLFDIDGDGDLDQVAWTELGSSTAFLARDVNGDGQITSGKELFGNYTVEGQQNGFDALLAVATRVDGRARPLLNSTSALFNQLLLWRDVNHNGISEADELTPAGEEIYGIAMAYQQHFRKDGFGNEYRYRGWVYTVGPGGNPMHNPDAAKARRRFVFDVNLAGGGQ